MSLAFARRIPRMLNFTISDCAYGPMFIGVTTTLAPVLPNFPTAVSASLRSASNNIFICLGSVMSIFPPILSLKSCASKNPLLTSKILASFTRLGIAELEMLVCMSMTIPLTSEESSIEPPGFFSTLTRSMSTFLESRVPLETNRNFTLSLARVSRSSGANFVAKLDLAILVSHSSFRGRTFKADRLRVCRTLEQAFEYPSFIMFGCTP